MFRGFLSGSWVHRASDELAVTQLDPKLKEKLDGDSDLP